MDELSKGTDDFKGLCCRGLRKGEVMEDRYLFKGKRVDNGEWVIGHYVKGLNMFAKEVHLIFEPTTIFYSSGKTDGRNEIDPDTICQCTGLKDKNGNLIWENDIVKDLFSDVYAQIKYGSYQSCFDSTKVEHIGFYVNWFGRYAKSRRKDLGYWINMVDTEIVGNTFDNPELLESEE